MHILKACQALSFIFMALAFGMTGAFGQNAPVPSAEDFAAQAAQSNMFELEAARLALRKGVSADVKAYASDMLREHEEASKQLEKVALEQNIKLPIDLGKPYADKLTALDAAVGGQFDPAYMSSQVSGHEEAVALFENYAKNGQKGPLRNFAARTFPTLRMHLIRIQSATSP